MSSTRATWLPAPQTADLAIVLVDARQGSAAPRRAATRSSPQPARHPKHLVLAVNKIDLVELRRGHVRLASSPSTAPLPSESRLRASMVPIPDVGTLRGDNVTSHPPSAQIALVPPARRWCSISRAVAGRDAVAHRPATPLPGAVCEPAQPRFPRLRRHQFVQRLGAGWRRGSRVAKSRKPAKVSAHRRAWAATSQLRSRARPITHRARSTRSRYLAWRRAGTPAETHGRRWRTSSQANLARVDRPKQPCCPDAPMSCAPRRAPGRTATDHRPEISAPTSTTLEA
jgi:hypothetical protein